MTCVTAKLSTTTDSDTLYMTDDLNGRLDPDQLTDIKSIDDFPTIESEKPEELEAVESDVVRLKALIVMNAQGFCKTVSGTLLTFSFGKGWHCALDNVDVKNAMEMAEHYARNKNAFELIICVLDKCYKLSEELDFTIGFSYAGACTFTVAADEGSYVDS